MKIVDKYSCPCGGAVYLEKGTLTKTRNIPCPKCYVEFLETVGYDPVYDESKGCEVFTRFESIQKTIGEIITCSPGSGVSVTLNDNGVEV